MGGAWTADDVLEFRCAGADLVGMGLHTLQDPAEVCVIAHQLATGSPSCRPREHFGPMRAVLSREGGDPHPRQTG